MFKRFLTLIAFFVSALALFAIPAKRIAVSLPTPEGTFITAYLCGDENCHFYMTENREILIEGEDGFYRVATHDEAQEQMARWQKRMEQQNARRTKRTEAKQRLMATRSKKAFGNPTHYSGNKKGLVILVNFMNLKMKTVNPNDAFNDAFNKEGYNQNNHIGSVHDYFYDQSYGNFNLTFDVIGPVEVSKEYSYYGENDSNGDDRRPATMVIEACRKADKVINFADYDWDGDGEVDQVYVVYAGYGEHAGAAKSTIWPHEYELEEAKSYGDGEGAIILDGVKINTYAVSCELKGHSGGRMESIGTACHEFCHCLGIPDFYDVNYTSSHDMGDWDLMASGSYNGPNGDGEVPCGLSAYERNFAGWLQLKELSTPCNVQDMPSLNDEPVAYAIYNDGNRDEFFVLENRQCERWFSYVGYETNIHGLFITHVDYDKKAWEDNYVNSNHLRMDYISAGSTYNSFSYDAVPFPGERGVDCLTNKSHINFGAKLYNPNTDGSHNMNKPITNIEEKDGLISFKFMGGEIIDNVNGIDSALRTTPEYYTINGTKLERPAQKGIYIMRQGGGVKKIVMK